MGTPRKFVRIDSDGHYIWAIADDGTAWVKGINYAEWKQIPPLPDREPVAHYQAPAHYPDPCDEVERTVSNNERLSQADDSTNSRFYPFGY